ncbi:ABC transporter permease [Goodfellowiella coeruleoviolacea]|uniref:Spermidine/putrescine transport system permease protein n=1 Tax=Goodfellowiella coeruleoviolacea TaxID=334858 RepID=A0AAE3KIU8_9PSEU|nr:ABC transporter permease [Goodfellowiella coeruleoviolacea]MCP2163643.1 putative spermidine/putrescine transport system permease protein [Goodfellowiella coeruleoviolacea]
MSRKVTVGLLLVPGLALLVFGFLYPFITTLFAPPTIEDTSVLGRLGELVGDSFVLTVAARTIRVAVVVTVVCLVFGFPVAYLISRVPARWRGLLLAMSIFPLLLSNVVRTYSWLVILGRNGLISQALVALGLADEPVQLLYTELALVIGLAQLFMPMMIVTSYSSLSQVDFRLEEAARGLGASAGRAFRRVVLPLALPGVLVGATLVFAGSVTAFTTPMLLGGTQNRTLATLLYEYANVKLDWAAASAVALIMTVIVLVVSAVTTRLSGKAKVV